MRGEEKAREDQGRGEGGLHELSASEEAVEPREAPELVRLSGRPLHELREELDGYKYRHAVRTSGGFK